MSDPAVPGPVLTGPVLGRAVDAVVTEAQWRRASVYVVCRDETDRLLLTRYFEPGRTDSGKWTMPGGGMEWGESVQDTALRELWEETGLTARIGGVVGVFSRWFQADENVIREAGHVLGIVCEASGFTGGLRTTFDGTTDAAAWFTLEQAHGLPRVPLVDFVLDLLSRSA